MERQTGIVKRFFADRGYGIVFTYDASQVPIKWFFHVNFCSGTPEVGRMATFTPGPPRRNGDLPTAADVVIGEMCARYDGGGRDSQKL